MRLVRQNGLMMTEAALAVAGACAMTATETTGKKTGS